MHDLWPTLPHSYIFHFFLLSSLIIMQTSLCFSEPMIRKLCIKFWSTFFWTTLVRAMFASTDSDVHCRFPLNSVPTDSPRSMPARRKRFMLNLQVAVFVLFSWIYMHDVDLAEPWALLHTSRITNIWPASSCWVVALHWFGILERFCE